MAGKAIIKITRDWLEGEYITKDRSMQDIALDAGCAYSSINRYIKLFGIHPKTNGQHKKVDVHGIPFGNWTPIKEVAPAKSGHTKWLCECKCGQQLEIEHNALACGTRIRCRSCGGKAKRVKNRLSNVFWKQIRNGAANRGWEFDITPKQAYDLLLKQEFTCALTGIPISIADTVIEHNHGKTTASLDRIQSNVGYCVENIQWVHKHVNRIKYTCSNNEFIGLCILIADCHPLHRDFTEEINVIKTANWNSVRKSAKERGWEYDLDMDWAWRLYLSQGKRCALSGLELSFPKSVYSYQKTRDGNASLDRIDSSKGYVKGNVQWVTKLINRMKSNFSNDEFKKICTLVRDHNYDKKI